MTMGELMAGIIEVIGGIIGSIVLSVFLAALAQNHLIPSGWVFLFTAIGFIGSIATLFTIWKAGIIFTIGWIIGAILLKDLLSTGDFFLYIVAPIASLIIRSIALANGH